ncbi:MAG: hypothetical protein AAF822_12480 [Pseudomonadota bacterium]
MTPSGAWLTSAVVLIGFTASVLAQTQTPAPVRAIDAANTTVLSPDQARVAARKLLAVGHAKAAQDVLEVLVSRDPDDAVSHTLLAHAHRMQGNHDAATFAARTAWQKADQDQVKYAAALAAAQSLAKDDKEMRAQIWLRRAAHVAPDDARRARAIRDYRFVRDTSPWSTRFRFGITPSDNVNNAPRDNTYILGGLVFVDEDAVPLSGVEINAGADLRYNFNISQTQRDFVELSWDQTRVVLTDDNVPEDVSASDFTYTKLETTLGRDWQSSAEAPRRTASLGYGRIWYGGEHLSDELSLSYRQRQARPGGSHLWWHAKVGYADRQDNDLRSGTTSAVGVGWRFPFEGGAQLVLSADVSSTDTDSSISDHESLALSTSYTLSARPMGVLTTFTGQAKFRRYDTPVYGVDARSDDEFTLSTSMLFTGFDTYGFAPKVTVSANRTNSNVSLFETQSVGVSIGFESVF